MCISTALSKVFGTTDNANQEDILRKWLPCLKCVMCSRVFSKFEDLEKPFCQNHPKQLIVILCCCRKFGRVYKLKEHAMLHGAPNPFKCLQCDVFSASEGRLRLHAFEKHPQFVEFNCWLCDHVNKSYSSFVDHYAAEHPTDPQHGVTTLENDRKLFGCSLCKYVARMEINIYHHYWFEHQRVPIHPKSLGRAQSGNIDKTVDDELSLIPATSTRVADFHQNVTA